MHLFFQPEPDKNQFSDEEAKHIFKVLRLKNNDRIQVTDGRGHVYNCVLEITGRKVVYHIIDSYLIPEAKNRICMAVAPTRKAERNEWMVEKMTEIGVFEIAFVITENTISEGINRIVNQSRLNRIAASAMKQSQQFYLPKITLYTSFESFLEQDLSSTKMIGYVPVHDSAPHAFSLVDHHLSTTLLIGPEGDFTPDEVEAAIKYGYQPVSLGSTRLRTETAAVTGCHALNMAYHLKQNDAKI